MRTSALTSATEPPSYVYRGKLLQRAEARTAIHNGRAVPVVCFDMELDTPLKTHMHVQQPFLNGNYAAAQAAAHRLKQGTYVAVDHPMAAIRIVGNSTTHIHVIREPKEQA